MDASLITEPVTTPLELTQRWADVLAVGDGPGDPGESIARTLRVSLFDADDRQLPVQMPIDNLPHDPSWALVEGLVRLCVGALAQEGAGGWAAMALERPGRSTPTGTDLAWSRSLARAARAAGLDLRPLHLAGLGWVVSTDSGADVIHYLVARESA